MAELDSGGVGWIGGAVVVEKAAGSEEGASSAVSSPVDASRVVVLVDFDGTITEQDVGVELLERFSTVDWRVIEERFAAGELTIEQNMQEQFSHVPQDGPTLLRYARSAVSIRPGWDDLLRFAEETRLKVAVVSGGLDFYVEGLLPRTEPPLDIHCLHTEYTRDGWKVSLPPREPDEPEPVGYKEGIVEQYRGRYEHVWFIGNGVSDRGAAAVADRVWAVEPLLTYCREHGIAARPFETFHDARADLEQLLAVSG